MVNASGGVVVWLSGNRPRKPADSEASPDSPRRRGGVVPTSGGTGEGVASYWEQTLCPSSSSSSSSSSSCRSSYWSRHKTGEPTAV